MPELPIYDFLMQTCLNLLSEEGCAILATGTHQAPRAHVLGYLGETLLPLASVEGTEAFMPAPRVVDLLAYGDVGRGVACVPTRGTVSNGRVRWE
jgi:hypothetical protein